jgi:FixJ family two-component response regulator
VELALLRDSQRRQRRSHLRVVEESFATLTQREREVFDLLVTGMLTKQVGFELGTTERTIKAHRAQILRKLGVASVADLVRIAVALGRAASGA